jgi:hypothetical protein
VKSIAAILILLGTITAATAQRQAPYDLWCRDQGLDQGGSVQICMAYTRAQCLASRASPGEQCYLNPRYDPRFGGRF